MYKWFVKILKERFGWISWLVSQKLPIVVSRCFWKLRMYLGIYELDPSKFLSTLGIAWQAALKSGQSKSTTINWYWHVSND